MVWLAAATIGCVEATGEQQLTARKPDAAGAAGAAATRARLESLTAAEKSNGNETVAAVATSDSKSQAVTETVAAASSLGVSSGCPLSPQSAGSLSPSISSPDTVAACGRVSPLTPGLSPAAVSPDGAADDRAAAAAAAKAVWLQHCSSAVRLEKLQELKETRAGRKRRPQQKMQRQQQHLKQHDVHSAAPDARTDENIKLKEKPIDYRGRPLFDVEHAEYKSSLLSHHSHNLNLRGFFNLFFLVLVVVNASVVTENIVTYGSLLQVPRSFEDLSKNWPVPCCFMLMHLCILGAYVIERFIAPASGRTMDAFVFCLIAVNLSLCFLVPFVTVRRYKPEPVAGLLLLAFSIVWAFKLLSMHHTCLDTRRALLRGDDFLALCSGREEEARAAARYPYSITFLHVYRFIVLPTMCFQFQYPFTPCVRWLSVLRHAAESAVCLAMMKIVIDNYIWVVVRDSFSITELQNIPISVLIRHFFIQMIRLSIPNLYVWLLMFIGLFHHWCNILAEITRFGDREFYLDWWNASSFGEYWRKWNLPIHFFLHRHVNKPLLRNGVPKFFAAFTVFLISALMHEYVVVVPLQLGWTGFIFFAFMGQIPLMHFTNIQFFQDNPTVGNCFFWLVFCFTGQPLGILLYWYLWGVKHGAVTELDPSRIALS